MARHPPTTKTRDLIRMGELSRRSGVPASTIKYYIRDGLLPRPTVVSTRNSALYDPAFVARVQAIKTMQEQFLPLWRIKELLAGTDDAKIATVAAAVDRALARPAAAKPIRRATAIARGFAAKDLAALVKRGILPDEDPFTGEAAGLVATVLLAQKSGLTARVDMVEVLVRYAAAVQELVRAELKIFTTEIVPDAGEALGALTEEAMPVSEKIVLHLRRRILFPEFEQMLRRAQTPRPEKRAPKKRAPQKRR